MQVLESTRHGADGTMEQGQLRLTFVFPCLNEERTLGDCIRRVREGLHNRVPEYEIVVADNGSTDRSREIAAELGCRVVPVAERGYGAALKAGIEAARGSHVIFADSDSTYLYEDAGPLYENALESEADMAIASRMTGRIEDGAMPTLHRWLGTPVLTALINRLFHGRLTDCNSGFRCVRKSAYQKWDIRASGMEFASELLIKALKADARITEIPSGLRKGPPDRVAHLHTWRDGMRHLLFILSEKPRLFELTGLLALALASILQLLAGLLGPVAVAGMFHIFDLHTQMLLLLAGVFGAQVYVFGCMLYLQTPDQPLAITRKLIHLHEGVLFFSLLSVLVASCTVVGVLVIQWASSQFANLGMANSLLLWVYFLAVAFVLSFGLLGVHVLKKAKRSGS